jgi:hypothetical protein
MPARRSDKFLWNCARVSHVGSPTVLGEKPVHPASRMQPNPIVTAGDTQVRLTWHTQARLTMRSSGIEGFLARQRQGG